MWVISNFSQCTVNKHFIEISIQQSLLTSFPRDQHIYNLYRKISERIMYRKKQVEVKF